MQDCTLYEIKLGDYAAGELNEPDLSVVQKHLTQCADCQAELDREMELRVVLSGLPQAQCPDSVTDFLHDKLALDTDAALPRIEKLPTTSRTGWWPAGFGLVAAALLAVLMIPGLLDGPHGPEQVATATDEVAPEFTAAEIAQARHDVIATLAMAAEVLDRSRDNAVVDVFGTRLPRAITESLRPLATDAQKTTDDPNQSHTGGNG